jgi:hypothetical protein
MQMEMIFALRNANNFYACLASINNPNSPNYGQYLNLTELQPYLPTPGDKSSIISHLTHRGFTVTNGASPLVLRISANVRTVEATFAVNVNQYSVGNFSFYGIDTDPSLPQNFASMVDGIVGLTNYTAIAPAESPCSGPYCPQGIQAGYSLTSLYSSGDNGGGEKVAIVDIPGDPNIQAALNTFDSQYGLASATLNIIYPDGVPSLYDPAWASETAMDVEAVHTAAPGAGIVLVYDTADLMNAVDYVASNHLATIVTNSWGYVCGSGSPCSDTELPSSTVSSVDSRLALDAAQGLTILFASGDEGVTPDGANFGTEFPASDPNVLAVGATDLLLSGCSTTTCSGYGSERGATISGGGYSGYFPEPSWQTSSIGVKSGRAVPDVSMIGGVDPLGGVGFWVYSTASNKCTPDDTNYGAGWFGCAGTSLSTPLWAGFLAVASQVKGGNFGNIDPLLYQIANSGSYSSNFHDVTSGSNGYPAGAGWDPVTGWGSPIANSLATALAQKQVTTGITVTTDKSTYTQGATIHYTGSGFTALGSIQACLSTNNDGQLLCVSPEPNADQNGNVAGTIVVGTNIPTGPQKFYVKDMSTGKFSSPIQLTVAATGSADFSLSANPTSLTLNVPSSGTASSTATITITSLNGWISQVSLAGGWRSSQPSGVTFGFNPNPPAAPSSGGTTTSTLWVTISQNACNSCSGTYQLTITGQSGAVQHSIDFPITINPSVPVATPFSISYGDFLVWRPSSATWYDLSQQGATTSQSYGASGDAPLIGDVDGDGKPDAILYRPTTGQWLILTSSSNYNPSSAKIINWGGVSGDIPLVGDVSGNGRADLIIYRPSTGVWYILLSSTGYTGYKAIGWGGMPGDIPLVGDVDGDGRSDLIIYRPSQGIWYILLSSTGYTGYRTISWGGVSGDVPLVGDVSGNGRADLIIYRSSTGVWYILLSSTGYTGYRTIGWGGVSGDIPLVENFDGDVRADLAIFRSGTWYVLTSSTNYTGYMTQSLGAPGDIPVAVNKM